MCVCDMDNYIGVALFSTGRRSGLNARLPAKPCSSVPFLHQVPKDFDRPAAQISPGRRLMKERKAMRKAHRPSRIAFLHLKPSERAEQRPGLRSALHIIIQKGKSNARRPRALLHHIKKELTTNAPIVPRSSSILFISSRPALLARYLSALSTGSNPHAMRGKKLRTVFLRHLLRHFLRHEHVGTMQLKPASEKA